jgi:hypothetical protein
MKDPSTQIPEARANADRRVSFERRRRHWYGLWVGTVLRRRREPRRDDEHHLAVVDWHHPQWLIVAMLIVMLSVTDAFFTLELINRGATEINPLMAPLVAGSGHGFAFWKLSLTISGVLVLTALSRLRLFGTVPVGAVLYLILLGYATLVAYESYLLMQPGFH